MIVASAPSGVHMTPPGSDSVIMESAAQVPLPVVRTDRSPPPSWIATDGGPPPLCGQTAAVNDPVDAVLRALAAADWATGPVRGAGRVATLRGRTGGLVMGRGGGEAVLSSGALPVATNGVDGLALLFALAVVDDLDGLFAELRRVLRPGGTLVVVVPSVSARSVADLRWRSTLRPAHRGPWRHRSALDGAGWLLTAADFAVLGDDRVPFGLPLPDRATAARAVDDLTAAAVWPPDLGADARTALATALADRARPGGTLPVPLRRLVARR